MTALHIAGALLGLALSTGSITGVEERSAVWLASDVTGMKVHSEDGEDLGKIEDIVVHPGGKASYAVLSFGGWMGMGDKLFAMPWSVLRATEADSSDPDGARSLILPISKERLKAAPGFDPKNWPVTAKADWAKDIDTYYMSDRKADTAKTIEAGMRTNVITWRLSELDGTGVKTPDGDALGDIVTLAIDVKGRVNYAVLSVGGFLGIGDRLVAVPWDALKFSLGGDKGDEKMITLATSADILKKAPEFHDGKKERADMCDPVWIDHLYEYYSCPPYWDAQRSAAKTGSAKK